MRSVLIIDSDPVTLNLLCDTMADRDFMGCATTTDPSMLTELKAGSVDVLIIGGASSANGEPGSIANTVQFLKDLRERDLLPKYIVVLSNAHEDDPRFAAEVGEHVFRISVQHKDAMLSNPAHLLSLIDA